MSDLTAEKEFPTNYSSDAVAVLRAMSLTDGKHIRLVGSMSLRSQQYAGDFDAQEKVVSEAKGMRALDLFARGLKDAIKRLRSLPNTFIADIKAGVVEDWIVIPDTARVQEDKVIGFNATASRARVDELVQQKVMTPAEAKEAYALLKDSVTPAEFLVAKNAVRPHIVRWRPIDVLRGYVVLRDGTHYTLQDAVQSPGITKIDAISWVNGNHFTEFSCLYYFYIGDKWINPTPVNLQQSLKEDIVGLMAEGKYFKALKRRFALAKSQNDTATLEKLQPILNGDLGRIYSVAGDIDTILYMIEHYKQFPGEEVDFELDQFRDRFARIYGIKDFLYAEPSMLGKLAAAIRAPNSSRGRALMAKHLRDVLAHLEEILKKYTPKTV